MAAIRQVYACNCEGTKPAFAAEDIRKARNEDFPSFFYERNFIKHFPGGQTCHIDIFLMLPGEFFTVTARETDRGRIQIIFQNDGKVVASFSAVTILPHISTRIPCT